MQKNQEPNENNNKGDRNFEYVRAVFVGLGSVIVDYANMIVHPLDTVIYPISKLAYDAAIIAAAHEYNSNPHQPLNGDFVLLQRVVAQNPQMYTDAVARMRAREDKLRALAQQFVNGTG